MKKNISEIVEEKSCYGCGICAMLCPVSAITMKFDKEGFLSPVVDTERCIKCQKCLDLCISHRQVKKSYSYDDMYYYGSNKNKYELRNSASGGAAFELAKNCLLNYDGVVYGVGYSPNNNLPEFIRIDSIDKLRLIQGTKYAQALKGEIYTAVKNDLDKGKKVLFFGTPCEVAALKRFLMKDYYNLICVQLICMGTTSPLLFQLFLQSNSEGEISAIHERYKKQRWKIPYVYIDSEKRKIYCKPFDLSEYSFLFKWIGRSSCYNCQYKGKDRIADITIGDFWGVEKYFKSYNKMGVSIVSAHNEKGDSYLKRLNYTAIDNYDVNRFNPYVFRSRKRKKNRDQIISQLMSHVSISKVIWSNADIKDRLKFIISKIMPSWLWDILA